MRKKIKKIRIFRVNKSCAFFPCHKPKGLEDCTFCYCPFYPCKDLSRGEFILTRDKQEIWSCMDCSWIHKKKVVDHILKFARQVDINPSNLNSKLKIKNTGVIILGHGSQLKEANNSLREIIKEIKKHGLKIVEPAYLQFHKPSLHKSVSKLIARGCKNIIIVPFFLFKGNHVTRDIPYAIKKTKKDYPGTKFIFTKSLGEDAMISNIVLRNINEAMKWLR